MTDRVILELLAESDRLALLTPDVISANTEIDRDYANRRLSKMVDEGYVERVERGKYRLTEEGRDYING